MALWDSCYFLNHFIIKVSIPTIIETQGDFQKHSGVTKSCCLGSNGSSTPEMCALGQAEEQVRRRFLQEMGWKQCLFPRAVVEIRRLQFIFFFFFSVYLLIIPKTQSRICLSVCLNDYWIQKLRCSKLALPLLVFLAFLRLNLEEKVVIVGG